MGGEALSQAEFAGLFTVWVHFTVKDKVEDSSVHFNSLNLSLSFLSSFSLVYFTRNCNWVILSTHTSTFQVAEFYEFKSRKGGQAAQYPSYCYN